jgi:nucleoside diphosphate kinase
MGGAVIGLIPQRQGCALAGHRSVTAPGTIRGDYALNVPYNIVPGSGSAEPGDRHIKICFPELAYPSRVGR